MDASMFVFIGTTVVGATKDPFVARDRIVINTKRDARVKIAQIDSEFNSWFRGKVEPPFAGSTLRYAQLSFPFTSDLEVIAAIGGEEKAETSLTELCTLMEAQRFDDEGRPLLTDGWGSVFFVRDINKILRTIWLQRYGNDGWYMHTECITNPYPKTREFRVFFRDPKRGWAGRA